MQDSSASICVTNFISRAFYGGLSPACTCWGLDDKNNIDTSCLIEFYSHRLLGSVQFSHTTKATVVLHSNKSSVNLEPRDHLG